MVYVPARDIKTTVEQAIHDHLWCPDNDASLLMDLIKQGDGVVIFIDGVDEVRDVNVIESLNDYTHQRQYKGGPKLLISSRSDLSPIDSTSFNRFLVLQGFTIKQGEGYVKKVLSFGRSNIAYSAVLHYMKKNKKKLEPILINPLMLHIYSFLIKGGFLSLKEDQQLQIFDIFESLEKFVTRREGIL